MQELFQMKDKLMAIVTITGSGIMGFFLAFLVRENAHIPEKVPSKPEVFSTLAPLIDNTFAIIYY